MLVPGDEVRDTQVLSAYNADYFEWQSKQNEFGAKAQRFRWAPYVTQQHSCLEFGSSAGYVLDSMPCYRKYGVEVNEHARRFAREKFGLITVPSLTDILPLSVDIIYSSHVLEHVECPLCIMRRLETKLKKGGLMIFVLPGWSRECLQYTLHDQNHHLQSFGAQDIGNLMALVGLEILTCSSELMAWPYNYVDVFETVGPEQFVDECRKAGKHEGRYETFCVGKKTIAPSIL
jgi:SAM-dependent methyltransferase